LCLGLISIKRLCGSLGCFGFINRLLEEDRGRNRMKFSITCLDC
jgi:hypothetical protein